MAIAPDFTLKKKNNLLTKYIEKHHMRVGMKRRCQPSSRYINPKCAIWVKANAELSSIDAPRFPNFETKDS